MHGTATPNGRPEKVALRTVGSRGQGGETDHALAEKNHGNVGGRMGWGTGPSRDDQEPLQGVPCQRGGQCSGIRRGRQVRGDFTCLCLRKTPPPTSTTPTPSHFRRVNSRG